MARESIPLRKITIEEIWAEIQKLRSEIQTHNHLDIGTAQPLTGTMNGIVQSGNFKSGSAGCQINFATGSVEFDDGYFRGDISGATGTFTSEIAIGSGNNIFKADNNGIYLGDATFASAPFRVSMAGALTATSVTITGLDADDITETGAKKWAGETGADVTSGHDCQHPGDYTNANNQGVSWLSEAVGSELPVANTAAKCTDANADQTSAHDCQHPGDYTASHTANNASNYTGNTIGTTYTSAKCTDANADQTSAHDCAHPGDYTLNATAITDANISSINFDNITASNISATSINTGTLTARLVRTAASGHRVELNPTYQTVNLYNVSGTLVGEFDGVASGLNIRFNAIDKVYWSSGVGYISFEIYEQIIKSRTIIPLTNDGWDLGSTSYKWRKIYAYDAHFYDDLTVDDCMYINDDIYPNSDNSSSSLGFSTRYFHQMYANFVRYKNLGSFQNHDDIQLIKNIKTKIAKIQKPHTFIKEEGKLDGEIEKILGKQISQEVWDENTMPKETYEDGFYDAGAVNGLMIGALKQLIEKVEELENRIP